MVSDDLITGASVSVSMTVVVVGAGICMMVSSIVTTGRPPFPVAIEPPSTGSTEHVALLARAAGSVACPGEKGNDAVKKSSEKAQSAVLETCSCILN